MTAACEQLFSAGHERVMVVGSDIPGITAEIFHCVSAALGRHDLVIVPAVDGGYCLIASRKDRFSPAIFRDIPWSTSQVLSSTLNVCSTDGLSVALLDPLQDIDTRDDLTAYCLQPSPSAQVTADWLARNGFKCGQLIAPGLQSSG
jgi:glycosyltransferase A (GT-A) superfamily protein (DUF2064 family)